MGRNPSSLPAFQPPKMLAPKKLEEMNLEELKAVSTREMTERELEHLEELINGFAPKPTRVPRPAKSKLEESRDALKHPCPPGMAFYESPEGFIIVAEAGKDSVWCREANGGKGLRINAMRMGNPKGVAKIELKRKGQ